ncbi:membrane protease YdiL (CAAX protease family) [Pedobacter metabolipauper]|uniref:Membrane protease YdiL (CAAX protease family) n=2 Tax=Pedobacter metabolipauper TaxID=425513 RepID=A0A4R6SX16_9SPHI|nr:membrane protease YdiL (CAAX protease family) [Pedobacter metabolipauper]
MNFKAGPFIKSILFIGLFIMLLVIGSIIQSMLQPEKSMLIYGFIGILAGLLTVCIFLKAEKEPFASSGLTGERKTPVRFVYGLLIGTAIFAAMIFVLLSCTSLSIQYDPKGFNIQSLQTYLPLIPLVLMEEIGFRSYPQKKLNGAYGVWISQIVVAAAFGLYHVLNGWTLYMAFTGTFVWAFVFGLSALWSGGIAMPTGIHLAVNILQNLTGLKGGEHSVWKIVDTTNAAQSEMGKTEYAGLVTHAFLLLAALLATSWYIKQRKQAVCQAKK